MTTPWRKLISQVHPEGIPWPGSLVYNALSRTEIFSRHYQLVAHDVVDYGPFQRILDIGTGPGQLLLTLHKYFPDAALMGVDISPAMVNQARKNITAQGLDDHIQAWVAGANALPFADESFDCVLSTGSFHHWKDPLSALSEAHRILKADGYALMYDVVREMPKDTQRKVRAQFGRFRLALLLIHSFEEPFLSPDEMEIMGRQSDFVVAGTRFIGALCCLVLRKTAPSTAQAPAKRPKSIH